MTQNTRTVDPLDAQELGLGVGGGARGNSILMLNNGCHLMTASTSETVKKGNQRDVETDSASI
jgi:hypothetical protein